jgi:hypothetical protein
MFCGVHGPLGNSCTDAPNICWLKPQIKIQKLPTVGAVKEYLKTRCPTVSRKDCKSVTKKNLFEMWEKLVPTAEVESNDGLLGPDPRFYLDD